MKPTIPSVILGLFLLLGESCGRIETVPKTNPTVVSATAKTTATFSKDIKPLLISRCGPCHLTGGDRVNKWDNFNTTKTLITGIMGRVTRVITDPLLMPKNGPKLTKDEIALLQKWIDDGLLEL